MVLTEQAAQAGRAAIKRLSKLPAMVYSVRLAARHGEASGGQLDVLTTEHGLVLATGRVGSHRLQTLTLEHRIFVVARAPYWAEQGYDARTAARYAGTPVLFHKKALGVDPASTLNPQAFAAQLRRVITSAETRVERLPADDNLPARYRFTTSEGGVEVLAGPEPVVVAASVSSYIDQLPLDLADKRRSVHALTGSENTPDLDSPPLGRMDVAIEFLPKKVKPFAEALDDILTLTELLKDAGEVATEDAVDVRVLSPGTGGRCPAGVCTFTVPVQAESKSQYWELSSVFVTLSLRARGRGLGERRCGTSVHISSSGIATARCVVAFFVPPSPRPRTYVIPSYWRITGRYPQWRPNWEEINQLQGQHVGEYFKAAYKAYCTSPVPSHIDPQTLREVCAAESQTPGPAGLPPVKLPRPTSHGLSPLAAVAKSVSRPGPVRDGAPRGVVRPAPDTGSYQADKKHNGEEE